MVDHFKPKFELMKDLETRMKIVSRINPSKDYTPFEESLLEWSVSIVGCNWTIIADVLSNYPLTSGQQHDPLKILEHYLTTKASEGIYFYKSMKLEPIENDGVPILGRFKPCLLVNRIMAIYPQRYAISYAYKDPKTANDFKLCGKRKMIELGLPSGYDIHEAKYKRAYKVNPMSLIADTIQHHNRNNTSNHISNRNFL